MAVPSDVGLLWTYAILLIAVASALPWTGRKVQVLRDSSDLGPGVGLDARAVHVGSSALLLAAAAGLVIFLVLQ